MSALTPDCVPEEESEMIAVCSAKPRPSVQKGDKGAQWWARDVYHLAAPQGPLGVLKTLCGRDRADWLTIGDIETLDDNCCTRCAAKSKCS